MSGYWPAAICSGSTGIGMSSTHPLLHNEAVLQSANTGEVKSEQQPQTESLQWRCGFSKHTHTDVHTPSCAVLHTRRISPCVKVIMHGIKFKLMLTNGT